MSELNTRLDELLSPIGAGLPVGEDARYELCYELMEAEVKKFGSLFGETVDWQVVELQAETVLLQHSKDLKAMAYITRAWAEHYGSDGLKTGLTLLKSALEQYGSSLYPARARGRDGAIEWLDNQIELIAAKLSNPVQSDLQACAALCQDISFAMGEVFEGSEASLINARNALTTSSNSLGEVPASPQSAVEPEKGRMAGGQSFVTEPKAVATPEPVSASAATPPKVTPPAPLAKTSVLSGEADKKALDQMAEHLLHQSPEMPLAYQVGRFVTWMAIDELPPHDAEGKTPLRLPVNKDTLSDYESALVNQSASEHYRRLEKSLRNTPFWLSGQRLMHDMLKQLGFTQAAESVREETRRFTTRLAGIDALKFEDDTPFADEATRQWLAEQSATSGSSGHEGLAELLGDRGDDILEGAELGQLLVSASSLLDDAQSGRSRFLLHLQLARLLHHNGLHSIALPHLEVIWPERERINLSYWEPTLDAELEQLLSLTLTQIYSREDAFPAKYREWLAAVH
ncbi:type VI secretion system protein TssA [Photobacterium arenosum]|uniref:type VI secretion system protein TssA n=1 Tax=Photobacterium arenosum TaxID=2774143 RepID=UPI00288A17E1|nr:type VI secretion system protein TssA [Photobacterium arenosum]